MILAGKNRTLPEYKHLNTPLAGASQLPADYRVLLFTCGIAFQFCIYIHFYNQLTSIEQTNMY